MIIAEPGGMHVFVPLSEMHKPESQRRRYHLCVPTVWDRVAFRRALGARGARQHNVVQTLDCMAAGIRAIYGEAESEQKARLLALVAELRSEAVRLGRELLEGRIDLDSETGQSSFAASLARQAELNAALAEAADVVAQGYEPFRRVHADNAAFALIRGLEATRLFLTGWDNGPCVFARERDGVPETVLAQIPDHHLEAIGAEIDVLLAPTEDEAKNSGSPSPSGQGQKPSTAVSTKGPARRRKATDGGPSPNSAFPSSGSIPPTC